eukprot:SAG31_NODE_7260_length_1739_cov_1.354268_2_plen_127_part_00
MMPQDDAGALGGSLLGGLAAMAGAKMGGDVAADVVAELVKSFFGKGGWDSPSSESIRVTCRAGRHIWCPAWASFIFSFRHNPSAFGRAGALTECHELLGIDGDTDIASAKKAYRMKSLELHPDRPG